jgi:hypothetical protein
MIRPRAGDGGTGRGVRGQPSAAERARTLVEGNSSAVLDIPGARAAGWDGAVPAARAVLPGGEVLLLVPRACPVLRPDRRGRREDLACVLEVTDVAPVSVARRVRGRVWVSGWVAPAPDGARAAFDGVPTERQAAGEALALVDAGAAQGRWSVLRLEVGEALVDDLFGAGHVEPEEFAAARPDPLAVHEAELLQHLAAAHGAELLALRGLLGERGAAAGEGLRAVPVALDRFGLRVRFGAGTRVFDARFEFPEPAGCQDALRRAMHRLFAAARGAGA